MAQILPVERTTPAARFVAEVGRNLQGEDVVWVDHGAAVSMHRVRTANPLERCAGRPGTATVDDNRISYGCINVPVAFCDHHVQTVFAATRPLLSICCRKNAFAARSVRATPAERACRWVQPLKRRPGAFAHMLQGMLRNYAEVLEELSQGGMAMPRQGHAVKTHQVQEATHRVIDATDARSRRTRQAA